ncbi:MAG: hypothetical protein ACUZ8H_11135 [Candidatus Anammoxibacter sp.]
MIKVSGLMKFMFIIATFVLISQYAVLHAEEYKSGELQRLMTDIDMKYKDAETISGYFMYSDEDWDIMQEAGLKVAELTAKVQEKYGRPDNGSYEKIMEQMRVAAQNMEKISKEQREKVGALEDVQWEIRNLRQTCQNCHRLLNIHIYSGLYHGKKKERRHEGIFKDWGKPD